jgi:hypothetical protein
VVGVNSALRALPSRTTPSLRGPQARGNPCGFMDCFAVLAMTMDLIYVFSKLLAIE